MKDDIKIQDTEEFLENLSSKLDEFGTRDKKGKAVIAALLTQDATVMAIENLADKLEVEPLIVGKCLALGMYHYRSNRPIRLKEFMKMLAVEGISERNINDHILPLLIELGVIIKEGERVIYWQQWDKIGAKPTFFNAHVKPLFASSEAKKALLKENDKALEEAAKLKVIEKQNAIAQRAKLVALQAANAHAEAAKTLETVPTVTQGFGAFIKQYGMPLTIIGLFGVIVVYSLKDQGTPANTPQTVEMAAYPQPTHTANYPQPTYKGE